MAERLTWLSESIDRAVLAIGGDASASTFLTLAFYVQSRAQGAVHLGVPAERATAEEAARFARALEDEARVHDAVLRVVWSAVTHGPHHGTPQGAALVAVEALEAPKELEKLHIGQSLAAVQKLSEESVLAIGKELRSLQELASSQVTGLKRVASQFGEQGDEATAEASVATTIDRLAEQMREFGVQTLERTQRQARDIEKAREWTAEIVKLGRSISSIASDARIINFNARLESARIGEAGRGFTVIAGAIQDLGVQVHSANASVSKLAHNLAQALPRLGADATDTLNRTKEAVSRLETQLEDMHSRLVSARTQSIEALADSSNAAKDLQLRANTVIEHLQFQDRASQMLQEAVSQVKAVISVAGFTEKTVEQQVLDQVGVLGREINGDDAAAPGSIELF